MSPNAVKSDTRTAGTVAGNVRAEIARRRITTAEVAEVVGIGPASVRDRLRGRIRWADTELQSLAAHLGIPTSVLTDADVTA